ncbi:MAG: peroxidase-related enzyme [Bryobacteraceae bacterium]
MAHIHLAEGLPGIRGLLDFRPETAEPLCRLADVLLHQPSSLSMADRELIATYVSSLNDCYYCQTSHGAIAAYHLGGDDQIVAQVKRNFSAAPISEKLKALLEIAAKVQKGGKNVLPEDVDRARQQGATDHEIHDTVLIAATFCMFNRYVDGLATWAPTDPGAYRERAAAVAEGGYNRIPRDVQKAKESAYAKSWAT